MIICIFLYARALYMFWVGSDNIMSVACRIYTFYFLQADFPGQHKENRALLQILYVIHDIYVHVAISSRGRSGSLVR